MAKNKVFIGYDYDNDKVVKDRLLGWDTNEEFDFSSYDRSFDASGDSEEAVAIKQDLGARNAGRWRVVEHNVQLRLHQESGDELTGVRRCDQRC